MYELEFIAW